MFELTPEQSDKLFEWINEQNRKAVFAQQNNPPDVPIEILKQHWDIGYPYGGAIGGDLTYSFSPTSLGVIVKVRSSFTEEEIDLTNYEDW